MDGHFVPNLSFGPDVVRMAKEVVSMPLSVHLMLSRPDKYLERFIEAGADSLLIHVEADCDVPASLRRIRELGARPGLTLNPGTEAEEAFDALPFSDEVLCMTVHPGYGGQAFIRSAVPKITAIRRERERQGNDALDVMVDGGIDETTGAECAAAGANLFVAGTWLFGAPDMAARIALLRARATEQLTW
jgi:ribulose-phosphate 3-epimerase